MANCPACGPGRLSQTVIVTGWLPASSGAWGEGVAGGVEDDSAAVEAVWGVELVTAGSGVALGHGVGDGGGVGGVQAINEASAIADIKNL